MNKHNHLPLIFANATATDMPLALSVAESGNKAVIVIQGRISEWRNSAPEFESQINDLIAKGVNDAHLNINSRGGSTVEAAEIYNIIKNFPGKITGVGGAIIASAATYIACACDEFKVYSNSQAMIHKPMMDVFGNEDEITSDLKLLKNTTEEYKKVYSAKFSKTVEEIEELWSKGDYWMNAKEMVAMGFATSLIQEKTKVTAEIVAELEACGAPKIPTIKTDTSNIMKREEIIAALGLPTDATDAQITAAITKNKADAERATQMAATAKAEKIEAMLDNAIREKKITADQKDHYKELANTNIDSVEKILASSAPQVDKVSAQLNGGKSSTTEKDRKDWTYADYREKDPEAFSKLLQDSPAEAEKLMDAEYTED